MDSQFPTYRVRVTRIYEQSAWLNVHADSTEEAMLTAVRAIDEFPPPDWGEFEPVGIKAVVDL